MLPYFNNGFFNLFSNTNFVNWDLQLDVSIEYWFRMKGDEIILIKKIAIDCI
tara:strand:+ start:563 stop:718 length:156 start_codon:yes stop_codon:yes gene_type:complete